VTSPTDTDLRAHAIVIFDGLCHFCDRTVQFILARDRRGYFRFAPSQSDIARALLTRSGLSEAPGTIVLIDADGCWTRSTASLRIARALGFPWSIFAMLLWLPSVVRDPVYALVARNRLRWFGRRDACRIPTPEEASRFIS
jgi:predicted DCC family thiol-disulfide oxidoreductase YuxK